VVSTDKDKVYNEGRLMQSIKKQKQDTSVVAQFSCLRDRNPFAGSFIETGVSFR